MAYTLQPVEFSNELYTAELLPAAAAAGWQRGAIDPGVQTDEALKDAGRLVLNAIRQVEDSEMPYSDCTDGRLRIGLADGSREVPLREKLVGDDTMTGLAMAEALGDRFYGNGRATAGERVREVVDFLADSGFSPCTHEQCGAAGNFVAVCQNIVEFAGGQVFLERQKAFVPVFDQRLFEGMTNSLKSALASLEYKSYNDDVITDAIHKRVGGHAVARYLDDGRGVKGHRERLIIRLRNMKGLSVDNNLLGRIGGGLQVFTVNDDRIGRLAETFGRGHDGDYAAAYMAGEAFTDAGHGTLGRNLRTIVVRPAL